MDESFEIWYPVLIEHQMDFEGHDHPREVLCEGHIVHGGRLLCGESREVIKNKVKIRSSVYSIKEKTVKARVERTRIHNECLRKYKANRDSAWTAWVEGKAKTPATKLPPLAKI